MANLTMWGAILLLIGGLVHAIPPLYAWLAALTAGFPWIQVIVGIASVIVALMLLFRR